MMACKSLELHHHFPKIAEESGFTFNVHRPRSHIDWSKIRLIDIESIIKERKFGLIEHHLNDILYCVFESEFDVRILDEGVIKMFRLAQLAVEYQQFCRHYLDRSVYVLREEITALSQELENTRKNLRDKEDELKKIKRKSKYQYRTPLPYGNDNIASMILKTLTNKSDLFPTTSNADMLQYNKCGYCDKVFLNQLYLKSHLARRHTTMEIPQRDVPDNVQTTFGENENPKLNDEIMELKAKLKDMEILLLKVNNEASNAVQENKIEIVDDKQNQPVEKQTKDAEVSTNNEYNLLDKIEEWKKEEHEKYNKEINLLRNQIVDIVNTFKPIETEKPVANEHNLIEQLHTTIKQQGVEIHLLRQELNNAKLKTEKEELERKSELDSQMAHWNKRAEVQTKQYEALLQKLNDVAQEATEARAQAEAEHKRAAQFQMLLQQSLNNSEENKDHDLNKPDIVTNNSYLIQNEDIRKKADKQKQKKINPVPVSDSKSLENLHRKAQELLNMASTSSSDISSASAEKEPSIEQNNPKKGHNIKPRNNDKFQSVTLIRNRNKPEKSSRQKDHLQDISESKQEKLKKVKSKSNAHIAGKVGNGTVIVPASPVKLVRSKITEEVHNRLVTIGVDPLKKGLSKSHFHKQRMQLQQRHENKSKKNPEYQKVKHSILAYLDTSTSEKKNEITNIDEYVSPSKISKTFSIASVISNVKSKALSLVKSNDSNIKSRRKELNAEVAKKALMLLKTPPDSASASPTIQQKVPDSKMHSSEEKKHLKSKKKSSKIITVEREKQQRNKQQMKPVSDKTDDDSTESDHNYYNPTIVQQSTKSLEHLIKSPARRPASATADYNGTIRNLILDSSENLLRSQSASNISEHKLNKNKGIELHSLPNLDESSNSDNLSPIETKYKIAKPEDNVPKQTKGVLKNASSTSSLNKKKVLFDMEAIQMKSVSASPSQSITDKSDNQDKYELGLVNLDDEEWDISSIENEPLKNDTRVQVNTRTSPKIAQLKQTIESQLARRTDKPSTALVGGVNLMPTPMARASSIAGSNTSLGSSILDESDGIPTVNHKAFYKPKKVTEKEDSEIDISEYSLDGITNKKSNDSF